MGRSELWHDNGDNIKAWVEGSMGMKEKEVGVVSDCNTKSIILTQDKAMCEC
jgi:hypothetical protein